MTHQLNDTLISELSHRDVMGYMGMTWINLQNLTGCNSEMEIRGALGERYLDLHPTVPRSIFDGSRNDLRIERSRKLQGNTTNR